MLRALAIGLGVVGIAACSLITGAGDLEVGPPQQGDGGGGSTSTPPSGSSSSSGASSASSSSGGTSGTTSSSSSSSTTSGTVVTPGKSPCNEPHTFCDDFDKGLLGATWQSMKTTAGVLDLDQALSVSPPQSFRVRLQEGANGVREALLHNDAKMDNANVATLAYDLHIDRNPGDFNEIDYGVILIYPPPINIKSHGITILERGNGSMFFQYFREEMNGNYLHDDSPISLPEGQWVRITIVVDFSMVQPSGALSINGIPAGFFPLQSKTLDSVGYEVGANYVLDSKSKHVIHVDNVTFDRK